jgi:hypothetical protein
LSVFSCVFVRRFSGAIDKLRRPPMAEKRAICTECGFLLKCRHHWSTQVITMSAPSGRLRRVSVTSGRTADRWAVAQSLVARVVVG